MQKTSFPKLDVSLYTEKLSNGLTIYIIPKNNGNNIYATFTTKYGSMINSFIPIQETKKITVPNGIAHFLEHKVFESEGEDPFTFFGSRGADSNASTSCDKTTYMFSGPSHFNENIDFLLDFVQDLHVTDENVEKEKGIIKEELLMYEDNPYSKLYERSLYNGFSKNPIRYPIGGTVESILEIDKEMLTTCYHTFYHPSNMFIVITGNIDPEETIEIIKENQKKKVFSSFHKPYIITNEEPDTVYKVHEVINKKVTIPKVAVNFKIRIPCLSKYSKMQIHTSLYQFFNIKYGTTSPFLETLKRKQIVVEDIGINVVSTDTHMLFMILGESNKPDLLKEEILKEIENIKVEEQELNRKKKVLISSYIYMSDSVYSLNNKIIQNIIQYGKVIDEYEEITNLTFDIFEDIIKNTNFSNVNTVFIT